MRKPNQMVGVSAVYSQTMLENYPNNPLIQALPEPISKAEFNKRSTIHSINQDETKELGFLQKQLMVDRLDQNYLPRPEAHSIYLKIYTSLINGYVDRCPTDVDYLQERTKLADEGEFRRAAKTSSGKVAVSIIGISGTGKTTLLASCLAKIPQVIYHEGLQNGFKGVQVTWMSFRCPETSSPRGFLVSFVHALDDLLGTSYITDLLPRRTNIAHLRYEVRCLVLKYHIGIIHVDELNFITHYEHNSQLNFSYIDSFFDYIDVPVVWSATPRICNNLNTELMSLRRLYNGRSYFLDPFPEDSKFWDKLVEHYHIPFLLEWKLTSPFIEYSRKLCAGIPFFFVRLIKLFYEIGIELGRPVDDPVHLLGQVYDQQFKPLIEPLRLIENGQLDQYEDIIQAKHLMTQSSHTRDHFRESKPALDNAIEPKEESKQLTSIEEPVTEEFKMVSKSLKKKKIKQQDYVEGDLRSLVNLSPEELDFHLRQEAEKQ